MGTFAVINGINNLSAAPEYENAPLQSAEIKLNVENPADYIPSITGKIILNVEKTPEGN